MNRMAFFWHSLAAILTLLCLFGEAGAQLQTLDPTDSLAQRRIKTNANFLYHQNLISGFSAQQHGHANKIFLDLLPASVPGAGSFLRSSGSAVEFSTDGMFLTNLNASALATGTVPISRLPLFVGSGASHAAGIVPDPGATAGTARFLREDASFAAINLPDASGVLPATKGGHGFSSFAIGDLFYANSATTIAKLAIGANGQSLKVSAGLPVWEDPSGGTTHSLLSSTHTDTTAGTVVRGDLIVGQGASPTWQRKPIGAFATVLHSNGTDANWGFITNGHIDSAAGIAWSKIDKTGSLLNEFGDVVITSPVNNQVLQFNGTNWVNQTLTGSGITSLNTLTGATQTFATGTSGTNFNISSSGTTHTFNIPDASATARGFVSTGSQTWAGTKTLSNNLVVNGSLTVGGGATVTTLLTVNATLDFPNTPANSAEDVSVTVVGAVAGDAVFVTPPTGVTGTKVNRVFTAWVSATNEVKVRFSNLTAASADLPSSSYRIVVIRF